MDGVEGQFVQLGQQLEDFPGPHLPLVTAVLFSQVQGLSLPWEPAPVPLLPPPSPLPGSTSTFSSGHLDSTLNLARPRAPNQPLGWSLCRQRLTLSINFHSPSCSHEVGAFGQACASIQGQLWKSPIY